MLKFHQSGINSLDSLTRLQSGIAAKINHDSRHFYSIKNGLLVDVDIMEMIHHINDDVQKNIVVSNMQQLFDENGTEIVFNRKFAATSEQFKHFVDKNNQKYNKSIGGTLSKINEDYVEIKSKEVHISIKFISNRVQLKIEFSSKDVKNFDRTRNAIVSNIKVDILQGRQDPKVKTKNKIIGMLGFSIFIGLLIFLFTSVINTNDMRKSFEILSQSFNTP